LQYNKILYNSLTKKRKKLISRDKTMASFTLVTSLPKFGHAGARIARSRAWNPRVFAAATPRPIQVIK